MPLDAERQLFEKGQPSVSCREQEHVGNTAGPRWGMEGFTEEETCEQHPKIPSEAKERRPRNKCVQRHPGITRSRGQGGVPHIWEPGHGKGAAVSLAS